MDVQTLSLQDAAYLAGLIDGEGTVTLTRKHRNENRQLAGSISNTEKTLAGIRAEDHWRRQNNR